MPKWLSTAGNQFNSWVFPQVPYSGPGLCRTAVYMNNTDKASLYCRRVELITFSPHKMLKM
jgi:hypothetical protein